MKIEKRVSRRRIVSHPAAVAIDCSGSVFCECVMMDVSATGAKLVLSSAEPPNEIEIPDEFILVLSNNGHVRRRCKVSWQSENSLGVIFVE
jgi:hypothetical protein